MKNKRVLIAHMSNSCADTPEHAHLLAMAIAEAKQKHPGVIIVENHDDIRKDFAYQRLVKTLDQPIITAAQVSKDLKELREKKPFDFHKSNYKSKRRKGF